MQGRLLRGRSLGLLAVALIALGAGFAVHFAAPSNWLDRNTVDTHFSLRGSEGAPHDVVVVGIDNQSLRTLPRPPIPRRYHARLIERLHAAGARLIVYDIAFDRPTDELDDEALLEAASKGSPIVFATSLISPTGQTQVLGGNASVASLGDRVAASDLPVDGDGVLRHTAALVSGLPTIAAVVSHELQRHSATAAELEGGWIDFRGPPGTVRNLSFTEVLSGHFDPIGGTRQGRRRGGNRPRAPGRPRHGRRQRHVRSRSAGQRDRDGAGGLPPARSLRGRRAAPDRAARGAGSGGGPAPGHARGEPRRPGCAGAVHGRHPGRLRRRGGARVRRAGDGAGGGHRRQRDPGDVVRPPRAPPAAGAVRRQRTAGRGTGPARARPAPPRPHRDHRRLPDRGADRQRRHGDRLPRHPAGAGASGGGQADHPRPRPGPGLPRTLQGRVDGSPPRSSTPT